MSEDRRINDALRTLAPQVLTSLMRGTTDFATTEDAVQEALLAAARQWPSQGWPDQPKAWLVTVAARRRIELWRNESARRNREQTVDASAVHAGPLAPGEGDSDDTLALFVLCCHPSLTATSQIALTLRAVGGLTTAEIARALLVPESTVGQRISRAKASIKTTGATFASPTAAELPERLGVVLHVLYLIFNEGYLASHGAHIARTDLSGEAIRLARQLHHQLPDDGETVGLLALMLLTDARCSARTTDDGALVPLAEQDRQLWDRHQIDEGTELLTGALQRAPVGPYQLQAAIAAVHDEAPRYEDTDWPQILALYDHLSALAPGPMITLNRVVAAAMVHGAHSALAELAWAVAIDPIVQAHPRTVGVRAHLHEMAGDSATARLDYQRAASACLNVAEQRYLLGRVATLDA